MRFVIQRGNGRAHAEVAVNEETIGKSKRIGLVLIRCRRKLAETDTERKPRSPDHLKKRMSFTNTIIGVLVGNRVLRDIFEDENGKKSVYHSFLIRCRRKLCLAVSQFTLCTSETKLSRIKPTEVVLSNAGSPKKCGGTLRININLVKIP